MMKGISQRGDSYRIDKTHKGVRITGTYQTLGAAQAALRHLMTRIDRGDSGVQLLHAAQVGEWMISKAYDECMTNHWKGTKAEATVVKNAHQIIDFFGPQRLISEIDTTLVDQLVQECKSKGNSGATINRKLACLSKLLRFSFERGKLDRLPHIPRQRESEGRIRHLTKDEEKALLKAFNDLGHQDAWWATVILIDTGLRTGECWGLTKKNIDFSKGAHGVIHLFGKDTKNHSSRTVPMTQRVAEIIKYRIETQKTQGLEGERLISLDNFKYLYSWNRAKELLGMDEDQDYVPHCLRHTCCTRLIQAGMPLAHVQKWMGHKSIQTTLRYTHLSPDDLYSGVDLLEKLG